LFNDVFTLIRIVNNGADPFGISNCVEILCFTRVRGQLHGDRFIETVKAAGHKTFSAIEIGSDSNDGSHNRLVGLPDEDYFFLFGPFTTAILRLIVSSIFIMTVGFVRILINAFADFRQLFLLVKVSEVARILPLVAITVK
jgi:hypothetical protein